MSGYSPGPWRWSGCPFENGSLLDANLTAVASGVGDITAYGCRIDEYIRVHEDADARLIAAAPELLAALKRGHDPRDFGHGLRGGPQKCSTCDLIARIEGEP